jgi:hypothetical protein
MTKLIPWPGRTFEYVQCADIACRRWFPVRQTAWSTGPVGKTQLKKRRRKVTEYKPVPLDKDGHEADHDLGLGWGLPKGERPVHGGKCDAEVMCGRCGCDDHGRYPCAYCACEATP